MSDLPTLTESELVTLGEFSKVPEFFQNRTNFFKSEIVRYVKERRVFRISIMGETRSGKSEIGSTIAFWYSNIFNKFFKKGYFDNMDVFKDGKFKPQELVFDTDYVCDNQQVYKKRMKEKYNDRTLKWGQIWQIDEEKSSTGGVGSMSEMIELGNLNNIIAKFNQAEIWIQPLKLETRNAPYGLQIIQNDYDNRTNWCLLFRIKQSPEGMSEFLLIGWVKIPLHKNTEFRDEYNKMKNDWIAHELEGGGDERMKLRSEVAEFMVEKYPKVFEKTASGKGFKMSKTKQIIFLDRLIMKGKVHTNFNQLEKAYIIEEAQMILEEQEMEE